MWCLLWKGNNDRRGKISSFFALKFLVILGEREKVWDLRRVLIGGFDEVAFTVYEKQVGNPIFVGNPL